MWSEEQKLIAAFVSCFKRVLSKNHPIHAPAAEEQNRPTWLHAAADNVKVQDSLQDRQGQPGRSKDEYSQIEMK
jgi:hypothetical protein